MTRQLKKEHMEKIRVLGWGILRRLPLIVSIAAACMLSGWIVLPVHAAASQPRACATAVAPPAVSSASASARISLNTASATVGTLIKAQGAGWPADGEITIGAANYVLQGGLVDTFDSMIQVPVAADGTFTAAFRLRAGTCGVLPQPGTAHIAARTFDGAIAASAPLTIVQTPDIAAQAADSGTVWKFLPPNATDVPVTGSQWMPGTRVSLVAAFDDGKPARPDRLDGDSPLPNAQPIQISADANGALSADVTLPAGVAPGTNVTVLAATQSVSYGDLEVVVAAGIMPLPVQPTIALSASSGPSGSSLILTGAHWQPGDEIVLEYCRDSARSQGPTGIQCNASAQGLSSTGYADELARTTTDETGHFSAQVMLPTNARPGPITIEAHSSASDDGAWLYLRTAPYTVITVGAARPPSGTPTLAPVIAGLAGLIALVLCGLLAWFLARRRYRV